MGGQPLHGRSIVVTRPAGQADSLCAALAALGAEPLRFPLLTIAPVADPAPLEAVARRLGEFELAFFVSPNAVNLALDVILPAAPWPAELRVATVGKGSEAALAARGFERVIAPQSGFDSESVLALPAFQAPALAGRRGLIQRACAGRLDALTLTSSEGVAHLLALPGATTLTGVPVFVPHPRIAAAATEGGFTRVIATGPGDQGLLDGLVAHFSARNHSPFRG